MPTNLFTRDDTLLGVCEGLERDDVGLNRWGFTLG